MPASIDLIQRLRAASANRSQRLHLRELLEEAAAALEESSTDFDDLDRTQRLPVPEVRHG